MTKSRHWPVVLQHGDVTLRPLKTSDADVWEEIRLANESWLKEWEATPPIKSLEQAPTFRQVTRRMRKDARHGLCMPFVIEFQKQFVGQLNVNNIVYGSLREANFGYWIDERFANRGIMTTAAALVTDYLLLDMQLHRVEIAIRPENGPSNTLIKKLGFDFEGVRSGFLHINGAWRDHNIYVMTSENLSAPLTSTLPPVR